jgi:hypothetical protein
MKGNIFCTFFRHCEKKRIGILIKETVGREENKNYKKPILL